MTGKLYVEVHKHKVAALLAAPGAITTDPRYRKSGSHALVSFAAECSTAEPWAGMAQMNAEAARLLLASAHYEEG